MPWKYDNKSIYCHLTALARHISASREQDP